MKYIKLILLGFAILGVHMAVMYVVSASAAIYGVSISIARLVVSFLLGAIIGYFLEDILKRIDLWQK